MADEGKFEAFIQATYSAAVESRLIDFQVSTRQQLRRELLDHETDGVRSTDKSSVPNRLPSRLAAPSRKQFRFGTVVKQLCLGAVIKCSHCLGAHSGNAIMPCAKS